ncbi:tandem-95 repeat protein [Peredibacter starrii]|uniref:Tandem-95 repeat protein n=1 Tax=Peredibacter starrii TaxID=28202 RepID=A0AAX4HV33_9BACT|nr:Ig-like domain-containing protein [Peredibacter starrii]WPU66948.1 tandem-95 repeat protein [Peredibacter starrii]
MSVLKQYLIPCTLIAITGLSGYFFFTRRPPPNVSNSEVEYEYSLKVAGQTIKTYRSPAAKKRELINPEIAKRNFISNHVSNSEQSRRKDEDEKFEKDEKELIKAPGVSISDSGRSYSAPSVSRSYSNPEKSGTTSNTDTSKTTTGTSMPGMSFSNVGYPGTSQTTGTTTGSSTTTTETSPTSSKTVTPYLKGKVTPLVGIIAYRSPLALIDEAYANNCTNPRVLLLDLTDMSVLRDRPVKEANLGGATTFDFDPVDLNLDLKTPNRYMLETKGCEINYQRIISSFYKDQNLDQTTTLVSKVVNTRIAGALSNTTADAIENLYNEISKRSLPADDFERVYDIIFNENALKSDFQSTFQGGAVNELTEAAPDVNEISLTASVTEMIPVNYGVKTFHWNTQYTVAYEWQVDGEVFATTADWTYTPSANSRANQEITLIIGSKNSSDDLVDRSMPYHEVKFNVAVTDGRPSLPPALALNAASNNPSDTRSLVLNMNTGALVDSVYSACESFSKLAITENDVLPVDGDFTLSCQSGPVQLVNHTLTTAADGPITLKLWSKDAADRVSPVPSTLTVELDTTAPVIEFLDMQLGFISDEDSEFKWTLTERNSASSQFFNIQFFDGSTWANLPAVNVSNGPHDETEFRTNFHIPNINTSAAKLKITYTDTLGHQTIKESPAFEIQRPILGSNPLNMDMGQVLNKSESTVFILEFTNSGAVNTKLCGPVTIVGTNASEFIITDDNCNGTTIGTAGCTVGLKAKPALKGTRTASATITCGNDTFSTPLTMQSTNNPPQVIATQTKTTMEDTPVQINFGPISDLDSDFLTYSVVSSPLHGVISNCQTVTSDYVCTYTPTTNYAGNDTFTIKSNDATADSNIGTVNVTVLAINDAPTLPGPQSISTNEDTALTFALLAGSDTENDALTYSVVTPPAHGTLTCTGTNTSCTYTPALNYNGADSFTYKANDATLSSNIETVSITVNPVNDPPVPAANQTLATNEDTVLNFTINSGSDVDVPAQTLSYKLVTAPTKGALSGCITAGSYSNDLTCVYTPTLNATGTDSFTYKVYDSVTDSVSNGTITINIAAVNDAPTLAATQSLSTPEDTALNFNLNPGTDVEGNPLTYIIVSQPADGTLTCTGGTSTACTFTPDLNFDGSTTFTYKVNDGSLDSTIATVTITVAGDNDPPVIGANQTITTNEDTAANFTINTATDVDVPAQTLGYKIISNPTKGTLSGCITDAAYGTVRNCTYTPNLNANGTDTFTYRANDGLVDSTGLATITINITPVNDAPTLGATQSVSTNEDTALSITLNAGADVEGTTLTYVKLTNPTDGTLTCTGGTSRACTYTPNANFNGTDTFTYNVSDGALSSTTATVTITVTPINDPPVPGANQSVAVTEDTPASFTINAGSDIDVPAQTLSYILITAPTKGTLSNCIVTGSYTTDRVCDYTPNANVNGTDTLTYKVYDSLLESTTTATITFNIAAVNDAPTVAATQSVTTAEDTALNITLNAGTDIEGNTLTYVKLTDPANGTLTCTGGTSRACTYTPNANFNGTDTFTYRVNDGSANSNTATVTITVTPVNDPPVMAANQTFTTNDNTNLAITLSPATDIDGGALTYKIVTAPANGTLSGCITTGSYGTDLTCNYISNANFNGTDSFTFVAYDTIANAVTPATVTITVNDKTAAPAPLLTLTSPQYTKVTGVTFTATSCTDTPSLFVNEGAAPTAGAAGWQTCSTTANAITYTMGTTQGAHTVKVWAKDSYGNVSLTSTDFTIYYDTVLPTMSLTLPPTLQGGATYSLAWTATETYTTASLNFTVEAYNGTAWSTVGTTASTAGPSLSATAFTRSWTVPSVTTAAAQFRVSFTDRAGNTNTVTSTAFAIDSTPPVLTITAPAVNSYHKTQATITGACETGRSISFTGSIQADFSITCSGGTYSQTVNFSDGDGNKTITVSQTDAVGNVTTVSRNLIRDEVAPVITKTTGNSPDFTKNNIPNAWGGTCEGNYTISVSGSQTTTFACTSGTWTWTPGSKTVDGTYSYNLVQTDAAGNVSTPPLTLAWTRDATPPNFTTTNPVAASTGQTKALTNNLSALTFTGTCEGTNPIVITGAATDTISCSASSWSWTTPTVTTDGLRSYTIKQTDSAGNTAQIIFNWTRDTTGPALKINTALLKTNTNTVTFTGTCENGYTINVTGAQTTTATCTAGNWSFTTASNATDATRAYTFKQAFTVSPFNSTTVVGTWIRETNAPTVSAFTTTAADPSRSSYIPVNITATSQNVDVYLSHVCVKSDLSIQPAADDSCFIAINGPVIGKVLTQTLSLSNYSILIGWTPKTYDIFVWVKDEAGNISNISNSGAGTESTDKINHSYDPGIPPTVWDVAAANIANSPIPPTRAQSEVPAGSDVFIRWKATDNITLPAGAISLSYTPDEINFTQFVSGLNNANYGCTGVTLGANEGCYKWTGGSPLNTSYKIRVKVTDAGDVSNQLISNPLNAGLIKIIAGNSESGLGGSAQTAMFFTRRLSDYTDPGTIVVTDDGQFYFADYKRGIITIDQSDGKQKIFIPTTGTSSGDGGPAVNATLKYPVKITLDYQNRLLIMDRDRIRRVDLNLSTPTIETIIGGGAVTSDTVPNPRDVSIYSHATNGDWSASSMVFFATPNGDIYFNSELAYKPNTTATYRIRIYKAGTGQVISKYLTGIGDSYVSTQDLSLCRVLHPGIAFDPLNSQLTGVTATTLHDLSFPGCNQIDDRYARAYYDPITFEAIAPKDDLHRSYTYMNYTGMDGIAYVSGARSFINRINFDGTYTRILGQGTRGECADGTLATACMIDIQNFFVTSTGKMYFTDRGVIRTIDSDGKVKSLFGQRLTYGNAVNALNARFSEVTRVHRLNNGKIIVNDVGGYYVKEFTIEGNINIIAGDGASRGSNTAVDANTYSVVDTSWMDVNRVNGDVYISQASSGYGFTLKLNRATGKFENVIGSTTGVHYASADNELGLNVAANNGNFLNRGLIMGFGNNQLMMTRMRINTTLNRYEDFMVKSYDANDGFRQSHIAGVLGFPADSNDRRTCDATTSTSAANCEMPYWDTFFRFQWDSENLRWITAIVNGGTQKDIYEFTQAGNIKKIGSTSNNIDDSFVYVKLDGVENFYYCNSGRIRRYNITTQTDMGNLAWSMTNLNCKGRSMDFNPTNRSIIFAFEQNGLGGVAEYFIP